MSGRVLEYTHSVHIYTQSVYSAWQCVKVVLYECEGGGEETEGEGCVEKGEIIAGRGGGREGGADDGSVDGFYF